MFPLTDGANSLVAVTRFCWTEFPDVWSTLDLTSFVSFGSSSEGRVLGFRWHGADEVIAFHHHMEGEYEVLGPDILNVYRVDYLRSDGTSDN